MKSNLIFNIVCFVGALAMVWGIIRTSYWMGWNRGADIGVKSTLDTVNKICEKQIKSDTSITQLVIINPDTTRIYLSRKTILTLTPK